MNAHVSAEGPTNDPLRRGSSQEPPKAPPMTLSGRDPSIGNDEELFGVSLDVTAKELKEKLNAPGMHPEAADDCCESMMDAVSLPGKQATTTVSEETANNIQDSLTSIAGIQRADFGHEVRKDTRWDKASQNIYKTIKDKEDLDEVISDVTSLKDKAIKTMMNKQLSATQRMAWDRSIRDIWAYGGFITVLGRRSLELQLEFLHHLSQVSAKSS